MTQNFLVKVVKVICTNEKLNVPCRFAPTCIALAQTYNDTKKFQLTIYFYKNITQSIG